MQPLTPNSPKTYLTKPQQVDLQHTDCLDVNEQARARAFRFEKDRELYLAAHIFLRQTLSEQADLSPDEWRFITNAYGKPAIANPGYEWLQFNLSHTQGLIACATHREQAVGIDVECSKPLSDLESLCNSAFSPAETQDVLSQTKPTDRERRFFTYWTLKEAYIKARGMGLSLPLQQFTLEQDDQGNWRVHCEPAIADDDTNWRFLSQPIGDTHYLALAIKTDKPISLENTIQEISQ